MEGLFSRGQCLLSSWDSGMRPDVPALTKMNCMLELPNAAIVKGTTYVEGIVYIAYCQYEPD